MMIRHAFAALTASVLALPVWAEDQSDWSDRYHETLQLAEVYEILRSEGVDSGQKIPEDDGSFSASPAWTARLETIYAVDKMEAAFRAGLKEAGDLEVSGDALAFLETEVGQSIIRAEIEARRALSDEAVEDAARVSAEDMRDDGDARFALYSDFIEVNDLINANVAGAMNANLAFYRGMASSPSFKDVMTEGFMLNSVLEQEPEIRENLVDWTMNFSVLAYHGVGADDFQAYIDISKTEAGQRLNAALFAGFDKVFEVQSYELGRASAEFMIGDDT